MSTPVPLDVSLPIREAREAFERAYIQAQLARHGGNVTHAAAAAGMERAAFHRKARELGAHVPATQPYHRLGGLGGRAQA